MSMPDGPGPQQPPSVPAVLNVMLSGSHAQDVGTSPVTVAQESENVSAIRNP